MVLLSGRWAGIANVQETRLDEIAEWFVAIAVDSKAQTTLTVLFGLGFAIQLQRADERGEPPAAPFVRRLLALFALGLLHVSLLWWGDVTWTYAVAGFGLLLFVRASTLTRMIAAILLCFAPLVILRAFPPLSRSAMDVFFSQQEFKDGTARMAAALQGDDHLSLPWEHLRYVVVWCSRIWAWYFLWTLGRFLVGSVAGQRRWFERDGADHLPVFRRLALGGFLVAACTTTFDILVRERLFIPRHHGAWGRGAAATIHELGLFAMVAFYVGVAVLLLQHRWWRRVLGVMAPVGRMPLTIYYSQSLIATFLFYGWGLGWPARSGSPAASASRSPSSPSRSCSPTCGCAASASARSSGCGAPRST